MTPLGLSRPSGFGGQWPERLRGPDPDNPQADPRAHQVGAAVKAVPLGIAEYLMNLPKRAIDASKKSFASDGSYISGNTEAADVSAEIATMLMGGGAVRQFGRGVANELGTSGSKGIRAYHGSPHDFDKFDISKIGTGEGAQAYGHGLYMAENEATAKVYRDNLAGYKFVQDALASGRGTAAKRPAQVAEWLYADPHMTDEHISEALGVLDNTADDKQLKSWVAEGRKLLAESKDAGRMYETRINASPDEFLDWDKPLPKDSPVRNTIAEMAMKKSGGLSAEERNVGRDAMIAARNENLTGEGVYHQLAKLSAEPHPNFNTRNPTAAAEKLRAAGIKGIRYLDQGSRTPNISETDIGLLKTAERQLSKLMKERETATTLAPEYDEAISQLTKQRDALRKRVSPTSNFVVFDDSIIEILRKYGIAGLTTAGAGGALVGGSGEAKAGR